MKKEPKNKAYLKYALSLDTVGVGGSIPLAPTIPKLKQTDKNIEIPNSYRLIPAVRWERGKPYLFRVLSKKSA